MQPLILEGNPPLEVRLRRSASARRLSLRVSRLDGTVTLSMPRWAPRRAALEFAREREGWIRRQIARCPPPIRVGIGAEIPFEGRMLPVLAVDVEAACIREGAVLVPERSGRAGMRVAALFRDLARRRLVAACDGYAPLLGRRAAQISLRDPRSRWGSCSDRGRLMFSWRLIMAPPEVLDYVAAHEMAHLCEMNHSPAFWALVERISPGFRASRRWLRDNAALLHAYRFEDREQGRAVDSPARP